VTREEIVRWVTETLVADFEVERPRVSLDARLVEDLDLDSLDAIDMLVRLQDLAHERIGEDAIRKIRTVGDVVNFAEEYLAKVPAPE
jgi:acyl carrier protein